MKRIELCDLTIGYGRRILLDRVSAAIDAGLLVALLGRNGTGKSTLLRAVAGLEKPLAGEIRLCGRPLRELPPQELAQIVSFVTTEKIRIANLTCREAVALGRAPYTDWLGRLDDADCRAVEHALAVVGMAAFAGALGIRLGGPTDYSDGREQYPYWGDGRKELIANDLRLAEHLALLSAMIFAAFLLGVGLCLLKN